MGSERRPAPTARQAVSEVKELESRSQEEWWLADLVMLSRRDLLKVAWHEVPGKVPYASRPARVRFEGAASPKDIFRRYRRRVSSEKLGILFKCSGPMVFELLFDVMDRLLDLRDANAESAIALLPSKVLQSGKGLMYPGGRSRLYELDGFCNGHCRR